MSKFFEWTKANRLSLNTDKTYYNIVSNISNAGSEISINGQVIERKDSVMFLRVS